MAVAEAADEVVSAVTVVEEEDSVEEADLEGTEEAGADLAVAEDSMEEHAVEEVCIFILWDLTVLCFSRGGMSQFVMDTSSALDRCIDHCLCSV